LNNNNIGEEKILLQDIATLAGKINRHKARGSVSSSRSEPNLKRKRSGHGGGDEGDRGQWSVNFHQQKKTRYNPISRAQTTLSSQQQQMQQKDPQLCLFFTKFGKCNNMDKCPFKHDQTKVSICAKFLRGKCTDPNCLLQHKLSKLQNRMPVCHYFLKGICTTPNCPYTHVKVNERADFCPDFLKGYCPRGPTCKLKHVNRKKEIGGEREKKEEEGGVGDVGVVGIGRAYGSGEDLLRMIEADMEKKMEDKSPKMKIKPAFVLSSTTDL